MKIKIVTWREGFQKVTFTKLQAVLAGLSLKESKSNTDNILKGKEITFEFKTEKEATQFYVEATDLGLYCEIIKD